MTGTDITKEKKIIALDMDGTLLDSQKNVSEENLRVLGKVMENGHIVCISTGRALPGVEKYIDIIRPNGPLITNNGAILVNPGIFGMPYVDGFSHMPYVDSCKVMTKADNSCRTFYRSYERKNAEVLSETGLEYGDAVKILGWGEENDVTMIIWCRFELFGNRMDGLLLDYGKRFGGSTPRLYSDAFTSGPADGVKAVETGENGLEGKSFIEKKYAGVLAKGITKILWYASMERISELSPQIDENALHSVTKCTSDPDFLEFFNKKVSKAIVLQKICELYDMESQDVIAMGDGTNDISMLQFAGLGIAMKNAPDNVKQAADSISEFTNDESGVARELKKWA